MRAFFLFLAFVVFSLHADPKDSYSLAVREGEPAALIGGCVSAITGDLYLNEVDVVVQGYVPLRLPRQYLSGDGKGTLAGWSFIDHLNAVYKGGDSEHKITIQEPNGSTFVFKCPAEEVYNHFRKKKHPPKFRPPSGNDTLGLTNTAQGDISGRNNLKNACVRLEHEGRYLVVHCSDQTVRRYKVHHKHKHFKDVFKREESKKIQYLLESETLSSGHHIIYNYDREDRLESIRTTNPGKTKTYASATFRYHHKHADRIPNLDIFLSDGRTLSYRYEEKSDDVFLLRTVHSPESPEESIFYHPRDHKSGNLVSRISLPDLRYYDIEYYREGHNDIYGTDVKVKDKHDPRFLRVSTLKAPVAHDEKRQPTHRIFYFPDQRYTDVLEVDNTLTRYHYSPSMRLESILYFDNKNTLHHRENFEWTGSGDLCSRSYLDAQGNVLFSRRFHYDERGNITQEDFCGSLSGNAQAEVYSIRREYTQDGRDLLVKEIEQNGKITLYAYHPASSVLLAKYVCDPHYQIKVRTFYHYNGDNVLIKEIHDDGASQDPNDVSCVKTRTIKIITPMPGGPFIDMPYVVEERYWDGHQEALLRKTVFAYTTGGRIERQDVYDALGVHRYSLHNTYDSLGRISTETNAIGQVATHTYDISGNKKTISDASGRRSSIMNYDYSNRLVQLQESGLDGIIYITHYQYDFKNNKTAATDRLGNTTRYDYDCFGHLVCTHLPYVLDENGNAVCPVLQSSYDNAGRESARTDAKGHTTTTQYNARSQVTCIQYADGSQERFIYNLDGTLNTHIDLEGARTTHTYDIFGRCTSTLDPRGNTTVYLYDAFHLIATQDAEGHITTYSYDGAGRKIAQERNGERIEYTYDALNHLRSVKTGDLLQISEYDLLDRITEERQEDIQGRLFSVVSYAYDEAGNQKTITRSIMGEERKEHFEYDSFDRLVLHTDAEGHQTAIQHNEHHPDGLGQRTLQKITTDALGQKTFETYDALNRNTSIEIQNAGGSTCSFERKYYDRNNNLSRQVSTLFPQGTSLAIEWEYDNRNRLISLFEPQDKSTYYTYTRSGYLQQTIKPDGIVLNRQYDQSGNLTQLSSSDGSVAYAFSYNALNQLISSTDIATQATTQRSLDPQGRLLIEKLANNLILANQYDLQGRRTELTLPNQDYISYGYDALHLREVVRSRSSGMSLYTHRYQDYDLSHHLISEELIGSLGEVTYAISPLGNKQAIYSPFFSQNVSIYDPVGNITSLQTLSQSTTYAYDDLYQLTEETGSLPHTYAYDSHYNRLRKDGEAYSFNNLGQLTTKQYDLNGNLCLSGGTTYTYDALDRMISVESPHQRLTFTYDSFHRRLSKTVYEYIEDAWQPINHYLYLYDGQNEIGAIDSSGKMTQLRVLGATPHAEIGASIAIELDGKVYAPLHDLFGNVVKLISLDGTVSESYTYDSFGNHTANNKLSNPWRFASKRLDQTGLIYFGRRYFDPSSGRWTTPDPIGFQGGINLYAFVQNNPLAHMDLYGLNIHSNVLSVTTPMVTTRPIAPPSVSTKQIAVSPLPDAPSNSSSSRPLKSKAKSAAINALRNHRVYGSLQAIGGLVEAGIGGGMTLGSAGIATSIGWPIMIHGLDQFITGVGTVFSNNIQNSVTTQLLEKTGMSPYASALTNDYLGLLGSMGGTASLRLGQARMFYLPTANAIPTINPYTVRFSQKNISNYFRDGTSIDDLAAGLRNGSINPYEVQQIRLVNRNNLQFTLDNRRLEAFRRAETHVPYRMADPEEIASQAWKFTTKNEGISIHIRGK